MHFQLHLKTAFVAALLHHHPPPFVVLTSILNAIFLKGKLNSMKKITLIIAFFLISHQLLAQDCTHYMYMQKNKSIEMTSFNDKGDITFKTVSKVSNVNTANGVTTATVVADAYDKSGKLINSSNFTYKCDGGVMMMDMSLNSPQQSDQKTKVAIKIINKSFTEYPGAMKVGDHLKDASTQMESSMSNGMTAVTIIQVTDRIVIGKETVTTASGTWDCFKITSKSTVTTTFKGASADTINNAMSALDKLKAKFGKFAPKMPSNSSESTIWYVPDFGAVKIKGKGYTTELTGLK